jgi:hypothetical protein
MSMSLISGRSPQARDARANAYYARLRQESTRVFHVSPLRVGADPQPFNFDQSYNYYSPAYQRPGPSVDIYRLDNCVQQYGTTEAGAGTPSLQ